jgi:hypothetical protein
MNTLKDHLKALTRPRVILLSAGLTLFASGALLAGPTDDIAECIVDSYGDFQECGETWYLRPLCAYRFEADVILCGLLGGLPT